MNAHQAITLLQDNARHLQHLGVAHASLFGSVARDDHTDASDVDIVITPAHRPFTLIDLMGVKQFLELDVFHRSVDVFTNDGMNSVPHHFAQQIHKDMRQAF